MIFLFNNLESNYLWKPSLKITSMSPIIENFFLNVTAKAVLSGVIHTLILLSLSCFVFKIIKGKLIFPTTSVVILLELFDRLSSLILTCSSLLTIFELFLSSSSFLLFLAIKILNGIKFIYFPPSLFHVFLE